MVALTRNQFALPLPSEGSGYEGRAAIAMAAAPKSTTPIPTHNQGLAKIDRWSALSTGARGEGAATMATGGGGAGAAGANCGTREISGAGDAGGAAGGTCGGGDEFSCTSATCLRVATWRLASVACGELA